MFFVLFGQCGVLVLFVVLWWYLLLPFAGNKSGVLLMTSFLTFACLVTAQSGSSVICCCWLHANCITCGQFNPFGVQ